MSGRRWIAWIVALVAALPGCLHRNCCPSASCVASLESVLPVVDRGMLAPDIDALASLPAAVAAPGASYHALTPPEAQCMAVANSSLGNLIEAEQRVARACKHHNRAESGIRATLALEARNKSAAAALEIYYRLAEGEAKRDLLRRSQEEIEFTLAEVRKIRSQGMQVPFDDSEFERKKIEIESQRVELDLLIAQGNFQLRKLLGLSTQDSQARIWPATDLSVADLALDPEAEVAQGMGTRPELNELRRLSRTLDAHSLNAARQFLARIDASLGAEPKKCLTYLLVHFIPCVSKAEVAQRRAQLAQYTNRREHELADEIRGAVATVVGRMEQARLAAEAVQRWEKRVRDLQAERGIGKSSFVEIAQAKLLLLAAQGDLVKAAIAWKTAVVKLKEAEGQLVAECRAFMHCPPLVGGMIHPVPTDGEPAKALEEVPTPPVPAPPLRTPPPPTTTPEPAKAERVPVEEPKKAPEETTDSAQAPAEPAAIFASPPVPGHDLIEPISRRVFYDDNVLR